MAPSDVVLSFCGFLLFLGAAWVSRKQTEPIQTTTLQRTGQGSPWSLVGPSVWPQAWLQRLPGLHFPAAHACMAHRGPLQFKENCQPVNPCRTRACLASAWCSWQALNRPHAEYQPKAAGHMCAKQACLIMYTTGTLDPDPDYDAAWSAHWRQNICQPICARLHAQLSGHASQLELSLGPCIAPLTASQP